MRVERCDFSGHKVYPSLGKVYVRGDSKVGLHSTLWADKAAGRRQADDKTGGTGGLEGTTDVLGRNRDIVGGDAQRPDGRWHAGQADGWPADDAGCPAPGVQRIRRF